MKSTLVRGARSPWQLLLRGVLIAAGATVLLICIFALLISLFDLSDGLIHAVNQLIKVFAIGLGVFSAVRAGSDKGLVHGALVGIIYMATGAALYALLSHQPLTLTALAADLLMGVAAGGLIGLLRAKAA